MISLGTLTDNGGRAFAALLFEDPERIVLDDGSERSLALDTEDGPMTLDVHDLLRDREPWEGCGLRVHRGRFVFAVFVEEPELLSLRERYLALKDQRRTRPSALA